MRVFLLIALTAAVFGCANSKQMVDGKSRLRDISQFGSAEQRVKLVSTELEDCPDGEMRIDYSFLDISSSRARRQEGPMTVLEDPIDDGIVVSREYWQLSCLAKSDQVEVQVVKSKTGPSVNVHFARIEKSELGRNFIPFTFVDSYNGQKIGIASFKLLVEKYRKYLASAGYKAFAVTDNGVYGFSYEEPSLESAISEALKACKEYKNSRSGPCTLVSVQQSRIL